MPSATRAPLRPTATPLPPVSTVPQALLDRIIADLVANEGLERSAITLVRGEAITWNDSSLGCPQPDMGYLMVVTPGYWVILHADNRDYDYRADERGYFMRCTP